MSIQKHVHTKTCDGPDLAHKLWMLTLALKMKV